MIMYKKEEEIRWVLVSASSEDISFISEEETLRLVYLVNRYFGESRSLDDVDTPFVIWWHIGLLKINELIFKGLSVPNMRYSKFGKHTLYYLYWEV